MLLALPPNQKGYRMALFFCLSSLRAALSAASGELMIFEDRAPVVAGRYLVCVVASTGAPCKASFPGKPLWWVETNVR